MSLLGEISKNSQALRYHAKTAEIAGQNLAHVNDESYARQKVLAREGVMYGSFGELQSSGLEASGLDHARSELLDKRVVSEISETASLEARKEILDLLQGALGETITRNGINVGLDDLHNSDLAPGSLTRALNDFFNAFQELSASPDEPTIKQEIYNKTETLVKRFNDAGNSLDSIEADLSQTIQRSVDDVNRILNQLHEVNKQVRRFELQDKGKAVAYRDRRQELLEQLSRLLDFKTAEDIDKTSGLPSGFLNVFVEGKNQEVVNLLDPTGPKVLSNDWGQEVSITPPINPLGSSAKVRAKVGTDGTLGRVEILDSGSLYTDSDKPLLVSFLPPKPNDSLVNAEAVEEGQDQELNQNNGLGINAPVDDGGELSAVTGGAQDSSRTAPLDSSKKKGEVFFHQGSYYQALVDVNKGIEVTDSENFMVISGAPNGYVDLTEKQFSDIDTFQKGDQIYYQGNYYQATAEVSAISEESDPTLASRTYRKGEVILHGNIYYQAGKDLIKGSSMEGMLTDPGSVDANGLITIGASLPSVQNATGLSNAYTKGQVVRDVDDENLFYLALNDVTETADLALSNSTDFIRLNAFVDNEIKEFPRDADSVTFFDNDIYYDAANNLHFKVVASSSIEGANAVNSFNPKDPEWSNNFHVFAPKLLDQANPLGGIVRKPYPSGHDLDSGVLQQLNIGIAEAVIKNGEITTFNIVNTGNSFPSSDAIFSDGIEIKLSSGSIHGYQESRTNEMERFRLGLNSLVSNFVEQINGIYNPDDEAGAYLFGFDAFLSRPVSGSNDLMEEQGFYGVEGNGTMTLFRDEVNMTLPIAESETFTVVNTTPVFPEQFEGVFPSAQVRGTGDFKIDADSPNPSVDQTFYASARRMQFVTTEIDESYPGDDNLLGTPDDGRSLLIGYETIPFRLNEGDKSFIIGDNFSFDAIPENNWNLATSLRIDNDLSPESIKSSHDFNNGANDIAIAISEISNEGEFVTNISTLNADIGNSLSDLNDNIDHQKSLESLLLDQRRAVSSVSVDEEVSNLMQFQRSFQASARVLNTLDKMLEVVVLGLVK